MQKKSIVFGIAWSLLSCWTGITLVFFLRRYPLVNMLNVMSNGVMLLFLLLFFLALGRRIARYCGMRWTSFAEECSMSFGMGSACSMLLIFVLAITGLLYELIIVPLVLVVFACVYRDAKMLCLQCYSAGSRYIQTPKSVTETIFLFLMGGAAIMTFCAAATPPFFFDALVYHLAVPQKYLMQHGFHYIPHQPFSNLPMNLGLLFIIARSFSDGMLAKLLTWAYLPLTSLSVYAFARSRWGRPIAVTAAAILFLVPGCLILATITAVDNAVMFYAFLCIFALISWMTANQAAANQAAANQAAANQLKAGRRVWLIWSALFCSVAIGIKYQAVVVTFAPAMLLLLIYNARLEKNRAWNVVRPLLLFSIIALCGVSPWMVKNFLYTGNPFYPFFNAVFGSYASYNVDYSELMRRVGNPIHAHIYALLQSSPGSAAGWLQGILLLIKVPWSFTMQASGAAGKIGVVFLLCLPGALALRRPERSFKYLLIGAASALWLWALFLPWIQRYVFPVLPLLSLVTAYIIWKIPVSKSHRRCVLMVLVVCFLYHAGLFFAEEIQIIRPFEYLFGNQPEGSFLVDHGINYYPVIQYVNHETPPDAKILFVGESRGYYCERDYVLYTVIEGIDDRELPLRNMILASDNIHDLLQNFQEAGFTHILINSSEMARYTESYLDRDSYLGLTAAKDQQMIRELLSPPYTQERITSHGVRLYEIQYP